LRASFTERLNITTETAEVTGGIQATMKNVFKRGGQTKKLMRADVVVS